MPEPDLYRPLIGMSVRLTERLTSRLPNADRRPWPRLRQLTSLTRSFPYDPPGELFR